MMNQYKQPPMVNFHQKYSLKKIESRFSRNFELISGNKKTIPAMTVFDKNGLNIVFNFERQDVQLLIHLRAINSTSSAINNFILKAAVPKVTFYERITQNILSITSMKRYSLWIYPHRAVQRFRRTN